MSQAPTYTRSTGFANDELTNRGGRSTVATTDIDAEFDAVAVSVNQTRDNLSLLQRDDGAMRDGVVRIWTLGADVSSYLTAVGGTIRGAWITATAYVPKDVVVQNTNTYICASAHTSGTFSTDLAAVKWVLLQLGATPGATSVSFVPTANISATNLQAALEESDTENRSLTAALAASLAVTNNIAQGAGQVGYSDATAYLTGVGRRLNDLSTGSVQQKLYGAASTSRTSTQRFSDVVDLDDWFDGSGLVNNDAAFDALLTYQALNPGKTYRGRNGRVYACSFNSKTWAATARMRMEGARFLWSGSLGGSASTVLTLPTGTDFDALRFEIVAGSTFRRMLHLAGGHRGDLVELICQAQVNNDGGSNLDAGIRVYGQANRIKEIRTQKVDRAVLVYGEGATAATTQKGTRIGFVDVQDYVTGLQARNCEDFHLAGYRIRGRSANALPNPGHNGILTSGVVDAFFGPGLIRNAGEHGFRVGGSNGSETTTANVQIVGATIRNSGQSGLKIWSGSNAVPIRRVSTSATLIADCGDDGDALGFNDFGAMIQNVTDGLFSGLHVVKDALTYCALDGVYASQNIHCHYEGVRVLGASRNGMRISEFNGNATDANSSNTVNVNGFHSESHGAEGFYVECPVTDMRDIMLTAGHMLGGTDGVRWSGAIGRAAQPCYFGAAIRGQSGTKFNVPGGTNIKTLDMLA